MTAGASAPGKVMLAGEYAVIDGGEAIMLAVDRRAVAHIVAEPPALSPFLEAAAQLVADHFGADSAEARAARAVAVDTSALHQGDTKLGLGSSAAATVAAVGCALLAGPPPEPDGTIDRTLVHRLAHRAHRAAQSRAGAPGSGADVAASVWGGLLSVRVAGDPDQPPAVNPLALPADLAMVFVWTGQPADTASLVDRVRALRQHAPGDYAQATTAIADAAEALDAAFARSSACAAVSALAAGGEAVAELGTIAGVELEAPIHRRLSRLAQRRGGALKPTGAGAGDIALAAFPNQNAADGFRADLEASGITCPVLAPDPRGVSREPVVSDAAPS